MDLKFKLATLKNVPKIVRLRNLVSKDLTGKYGDGHWSLVASENNEVMGITDTSRVLLAYQNKDLVGTLRLAQKKPWAIDVSYFTERERPLYLIDMAVTPSLQKNGIGARMIEEAKKISRAWSADAIRLDAYDSNAGPGDFYRKCGFKEVGRVIYRKVPFIYYEMMLLNMG